MVGWLIHKILKKLDISSQYAYVIGVFAMIVSTIVSIITFFKLWLHSNTSFVTSFIISSIVFYIFTEIYMFIVLLGLRYFEKTEDKL